MSEPQDDKTAPPAPPVDRAALEKARRGRNIAIALGLVAFIVIVYGVTLIRMGANVGARPF